MFLNSRVTQFTYRTQPYSLALFTQAIESTHSESAHRRLDMLLRDLRI